MKGKCVVAALVCAASLNAQTLFEAVEPHMGTMFEIKLYANTKEEAQKGFQQAFQRIADLDHKLSDYKPDSELNLATAAAVNRPVHVSDDLARVLIASQKLSAATDGAFDITVGPLTKLWRQARKQNRVPTDTAIQAAKAECGYQKLHINATNQTMEVDQPGMQLDLGAIAKGYAADEALSVLQKLGIHQSLVAASGDLAFGDAPPGKKGWKIGVDSFDRVVLLTNAAVSTSGGSEQHMDANGLRYSHIINPKTGMGLTTDLTVTTIAPSGLLADPAATAISVLGCDKGIAFVEKTPDLAAFISEKTGDQLHSLESTRFRKLTNEPSR